MKGINKILMLLLVSVSCWNCSKTLENPSGIGTEYFPLKTGAYRIYDVTSISYVYSGDNDTSRYLLKECVEDSFTNLASDISYLLKRYKKFEGTDEWIVDSVWTARKNLYYAVVVENNVPKTKLVFPVKENTSWNGNSLNSLDEDEYRMIDVKKSYSVSDIDFDKTITVEQEYLDDEIVKSDLQKEVYAASVGLIYKEIIILNFCTEAACIGQGKVESGMDYRQSLIEYGEE